MKPNRQKAENDLWVTDHSVTDTYTLSFTSQQRLIFISPKQLGCTLAIFFYVVIKKSLNHLVAVLQSC